MAYTAIWKVAALGVGPQGEAIVNTFHLATEGTEPITRSAVDIATGFQPIFETNFPFCVTADWAGLTISALAVKGPNLGKSGSIDMTAGLVGTLPGPSAPLTVAVIGIRRSGAVGRHSRGRSFLSPTTAGDVTVDGKYTDPGGVLAQWGAVGGSGPLVGGIQYDAVLYNTVANDCSKVIVTALGRTIGVQRRRRLRLPN